MVGKLLMVVCGLLGLAGTMGFAQAPVASKAAPARSQIKAVVHINFLDAERQGHGLGNVENILKATGGAAYIEVVVHGAGISLLVKGQSKHADQVEKLSKQGVRFVACENTMRKKSIGKDQLLPGVATVPSGGVEVLLKQQQGFSYFKP